MPRIVDLIAVVLVAAVLLMPRPSVRARQAMQGQPIELDWLAELQDQRVRQPEDVAAAVALADAHLTFLHPEWALSTLERFSHRPDYRVHLRLATARAERLETELALSEARRVETLCDDEAAQPPCRPGTLARVGIIRRAMQTLVDQHIDPAKDPLRARKEVAKVLHSARYGNNK